MGWHAGLKRLRLIGTAALVIGVVLCASVLITGGFGYAPDPSVVQLFSAMWPIGLALALLGGLVWIGVWVLQAFIPPAPPAPSLPESEPRRAHLDQ